MANPQEKEIEGRLRKRVEARGGKCLKWVCPGWSGVPDRLCLLPGGRIFFVETKRPKGSKTAELQKYWARVLKDLDFPHYFIFTFEDVESFVADLDAGLLNNT